MKNNKSLSRRDFIQKSAASAAGLAVGSSLLQRSTEKNDKSRLYSEEQNIIAIQVDSTMAVAEGVERALDEMQERASVNTLLIDTFWFARDVSADQVGRWSSRKRPVIEHDSPLIGGKMGFVNPVYYKDTKLDLQPLAKVDGVPDILSEICTVAKRRGVKVFSLFKDHLPRVPGYENLIEYDFNGERGVRSCKNNPYYHNMLRGAMEDLVHSYDVDGVMYMAERQGPFSNTLGMRFRGVERGFPGRRTCFCSYCRETAKKAGINVERAIKGFEELANFTAAGRAGERPVDGYYVTLWRLMLQYPELLAWEHMWSENMRSVYKHLYKSIKEIRSSVLYGMHVWPNISMNPLLSAEHDFQELGKYHDFIKLAIYSNAGGPRMGSYIESVGQTMFGDIPHDELLQFQYRVMNYDEVPFHRIRQTGLKNDFVHRQTKRVVEGAKGTKAKILPGIEVNIPITQLDMGNMNMELAAKQTRDDVKQDTLQAFKAGAAGIVISRDYCEMSLDNLSGIGDAIKELGLKT